MLNQSAFLPSWPVTLLATVSPETVSSKSQITVSFIYFFDLMEYSREACCKQKRRGTLSSYIVLGGESGERANNSSIQYPLCMLHCHFFKKVTCPSSQLFLVTKVLRYFILKFYEKHFLYFLGVAWRGSQTFCEVKPGKASSTLNDCHSTFMLVLIFNSLAQSGVSLVVISRNIRICLSEDSSEWIVIFSFSPL